MRFFIILFVLFSFSSSANAKLNFYSERLPSLITFEHGGGLSKDHCHWDRKKGTRHCQP